MPRFNASQQAAIDAQNQNILVSAAAGSGKTTVMVEKIKQTLIKRPEASISQFLVITFTKDAAQNMKDKLRTLLEDASQDGVEAAAKALSEIETASISTIHSFCTQLLKEYNDNAGAAMNPRVLKDAEKKRMLDECFTDAVEVIMGKGSPFDAADKKAVSDLLIAFSMEDLMKMVQDLYNVLMGIPNPFDFLQQIVQTPPYDLWNQEILKAAELDVLGLEECLHKEEELMLSPLALPVFEPIVESDQEKVGAFLEAYDRAQTGADKLALMEAAAKGFDKAPAPRGLDDETKVWKDAINDVRNEMKGSKGILATAARRLQSMLDEKNDQTNAVIQRELRGLELIVRETAKQYEQQKLEAGAIDYADMEQIAYSNLIFY